MFQPSLVIIKDVSMVVEFMKFPKLIYSENLVYVMCERIKNWSYIEIWDDVTLTSTTL